ncbi:MASE4 domain-containing protein [Edwardsiella piscicida]|uniref:MASE4 domain-containing protein n=1 Tax=Edwardsiella piscicida TaxID=1263550 RepID=UPI00370DAD97
MKWITTLLSRGGGPLGILLLFLTLVCYCLIFLTAAQPMVLLRGFIAVCNAILLIMHIFIALFIFMQFNCERQQIYKIPLIVSYLLSASLLLCSLLFCQDIFFPEYKNALTLNDFVLFYLIRYSGMAMLFLYALYLYRRQEKGAIALCPVVALSLTMSVAVALGALLLSNHSLHSLWLEPRLLQVSQNYQAGYRQVVLPFMCTLWGALALLLIWQTRLATRFWLAVTLASLIILGGFVLQWRSPQVSSVGWYGSLLFGLVANFYVMEIFLYDIFQRYRRIQIEYAISYNNAIRDGLTQTFNRAYYYGCLQRALPQCGATYPLGVLMMDIDRFKLMNDRYGHLSGDRVLCEVARAIGRGARPEDVVARVGGDEFCVLLYRADAAQTRAVAERICRDMAALPLTALDGTPLSVTLSIGGVVCEESRQSAQACVAQADMALYQAKLAGRNRVVMGSLSAG